MTQAGIVIVGGGHGGSQCAVSLRAEGYDGPLTLVSAESDLPYQRPPLSKAFLKDPHHQLLPLRPESVYAKQGITLCLGTEVTDIDRAGGALALADGGTLPYQGLVLALGARPRIPNIEGIELDGVFALRVAADARKIRDRLTTARDVVVIGGGFIGLEIAATARLLGRTVTVLEALDRLMARLLTPVMSAHFLALHRGWGSTVKLGTSVTRIVGETGRAVAVEASHGERIPADLVIIGIGAMPNVELAAASGLAVENGIAVDETMMTADPRIAVIGDCANFQHWQLGRRVRLESVQNAVDQGKAAAQALLGKGKPFHEVPWFWSDQGDVKLQMAGLSLDATRHVARGRPEDGHFSIFHYAGDRLVAVDSVNRAADHMIGRRLIGAGISPPAETVADEGADLKHLLPRAPSPH